jgi:integrase
MEQRLPTVDTVVKGIGRIKRSAGTSDLRTVKAIRSWLREMKRDNRTEIFLALRDGRNSPNELYQAYKRGKLDSVLKTWESSGGFPMMFRWLDSYAGAGEGHKKNMRNHFQQLEKLAPFAPIQELPNVLAKYRSLCAQRGTERMFQSVRSSLLSFLNNHEEFGEDHPLYVAAKKVKPQSAAPKKGGQALHLCDIKRLVQGMPEDLRHQVWSMVFTGIELGVYERGRYTNHPTHIHIAGTKAARGDNRRDREVPRFWVITPMVRKRKAFRMWLTRYSKLNGLERNVTPKDLRNAYARLLYEAGLPEVRCEMYMGHAPATMTRRYARHKAKDVLLPDAERLSEFVQSAMDKCGRSDEQDVGPIVESTTLDTRMFMLTPKPMD